MKDVVVQSRLTTARDRHTNAIVILLNFGIESFCSNFLSIIASAIMTCPLHRTLPEHEEETDENDEYVYKDAVL